MKDAIVLVSVSQGTENGGIDAMQRAIAGAFLQCDLFAAYTGRHLQAASAHSRLSEVLRMVRQKGTRRILVVPLYLLQGSEYQRLQQELAESNITPLSPPFAQQCYRRQLAEILCERCAKSEEKLWLLVGHGSKCDDGFYSALQRDFTERGREDCRVFTLMEEHAVKWAIQHARAVKAKTVVLRPLLLGSGKHAERDLFGEKNSWKSCLQAAGFVVELQKTDLGNLPEIQQIYLTEIEKRWRDMDGMEPSPSERRGAFLAGNSL